MSNFVASEHLAPLMVTSYPCCHRDLFAQDWFCWTVAAGKTRQGICLDGLAPDQGERGEDFRDHDDRPMGFNPFAIGPKFKTIVAYLSRGLSVRSERQYLPQDQLSFDNWRYGSSTVASGAKQRRSLSAHWIFCWSMGCGHREGARE
jgi:hypothetical protein